MSDVGESDVEDFQVRSGQDVIRHSAAARFVHIGSSKQATRRVTGGAHLPFGTLCAIYN
jgi:hypothetical protein